MPKPPCELVTELPSNGCSMQPAPVAPVLGPRIAVSLDDLGRMDLAQRVRLTRGKLDKVRIVKITVGLVKPLPCLAFNCALLDAAMACDLIRANDRLVGESPCRTYLKRVESWSRVPDNVFLTMLLPDGQAALNPELFKVMTVVPPAAPTPPPFQAVERGEPLEW